ncbi:hypothetical protein [Solimicrobium silvestre]|uniref:Uncharacterized protein n=1 Tax=Solimicrobium silvestre TaxID=2099400 RepID=A0A2S9GZT7_9BURK|nr:hypothetical protein [Solimicrobium silvestre]PRC93244.1 hypothetical protein S2091_1982 [Solimicrobium silvestre]
MNLHIKTSHYFYLLTACAALISFAPQLSYADGLADMKSALTRGQGQTPVKAIFDVKIKNREGEGKELEETNGLANVMVEDNAHGLQLQFGRELMSKLDLEQRTQEHDSKAKTPTVTAAKELSSTEAQHMLYAASSISRSLEKAVFKSERAESWNGKPARLLSFEYSQDKMSEKDRKYVKKFNGTVDIWIAQDGTPLASRKLMTVSGSAMIVISFESSNEESEVYAMVGDRLIVTRKENKTSQSAFGEKGESSTVKTLQVQS